jgi:hypothetical protein
MCFVWIWEQTAIISLYSMNSEDCRNDMLCVYGALRSEILDLFLSVKKTTQLMLPRQTIADFYATLIPYTTLFRCQNVPRSKHTPSRL